jgi:hypothetical protein
MIAEQPVSEPPPAQPPTSRVGRLQFAVIGAVVVLAAAIGLVLGLTVLQDRGQTSLGGSAAYVPANAAIYMEARLDLPAGQRDSLRAILERFPTLDPDVVLGEALAQTLDGALASSNAPFSYSGDIAPWFDGRLAVTLLDYPLNTDPASMQLPATAALLGVSDAAAAATFADAIRTELGAASGSTFTSTNHGGTTIWTLDVDETVPLPMQGVGFAYALTDDQLLLANGTATVEALLNTHAGAGDNLAERDELTDLSSHLPAEWSGIVTVDLAAMLESTRTQLEASSPELADALDVYLDAIPSFAATTIGFEDDVVRFDGVSTMPGGELAPSNGQRDLAASVPQDAIFFADGPNVGPGLAQAITGMRASLAALPDSDMTNQQIEQVEAALGANLEDFVTWIGSGAMAAGWDGEQAWFGLVLEAADADAASQRLGQLRALVELAAMEPSTEVDVSSETVGDVEVTSITVAGTSMGGAIPVDSLVVQYALAGDRAVIGFGDRFVGRVLEVASGGSLAESDRFQTAVQRFGGQDNAGAFFLDLVALREAVEGAIPDVDAAAMTTYANDVRPNLLPLDYLAGVTRVEGEAVVSRYGVVFR